MEYQIITGIFILQTLLSSAANNKIVSTIAFGIASSLVCFLCWNLLLPDYLPYQESYNKLATQTFSNEAFLEPGWLLLQKLFIQLGLEFQTFRIVVLASLLLLTYYFYASLLKTPALAMVIYVSLLFYPDSYMLRASLAQSVLGVAFIFFFVKEKKIYGGVTLLLATTIHYSALVALPVFFFAKKNIQKSTALFLIIAVVALQQIEIKSLLIDLLRLLENPYIDHKLMVYEGSMHFEEATLGFAALIWLATTVAYVIVARPDWQHRGAIISMALAGIVALFVFSDVMVFANRLFRLFCPVYPLMLALMVQRMDMRSRLLASVTLLFFSALGSYLIAPHDFYRVV